MKNTGNSPAFPRPFSEDRNSGDRPEHHWAQDGITIRQYYAAKAMQTLIATFQDKWEIHRMELLAQQSFKMADEMIKYENK